MKKTFVSLLIISVMLLTLISPSFATEEKLMTAPIGIADIDGVIDDVWAQVEAVSVTNLKAGSYKGDSTIDESMYGSLDCKVLWDGFNIIYILFEVKDKTISTSGTNDWEKDSIEFYIDQKNDKSAAYGLDDGQYRVVAKEGSESGISGNFEKYAVKMTDDGYVVEAEYWFTAVSPKAGDIVGFDLQLNDDALGDGTRHACLGWSDANDTASSNTGVWGNLTFSGAVVGETRDAAETKAPMPVATKDGELIDITKLSGANAMDYVLNDDGSVTFSFDDNQDPYITIGVGTYMQVNAEDYPYFAMYLKTNDDTNGQMFFKSSESTSTFAEAYSTQFIYEYVTGNQIVVVDFSENTGWLGDVIELRYDVFNGGPYDYEESSVTLYAAAFFKTYEAASEFAIEGITVELDPELTVPLDTEPKQTEAMTEEQTNASTTAGIVTEAPDNTKGEDTKAPEQDKGNPVIWIIIGVAAVAVIVVVVLIIVKKKK